MSTKRYIPLDGIRYPFSVAVLTDTHVPDRNPQLPEKLLTALRDIKPDAIFHTGDISLLSVLIQLKSIAPLYAVRGNRDFIFGHDLPHCRRMSIGGVNVALTHGHGSLFRYISDKAQYYNVGYDFDRYRRYFDHDFPDAHLVIFGHTHTPVDLEINNRRYFNSGATYPCQSNDFKPCIGRIVFGGHGKYSTSLINL
jgi:putative phosphoesterase